MLFSVNEHASCFNVGCMCVVACSGCLLSSVVSWVWKEKLLRQLLPVLCWGLMRCCCCCVCVCLQAPRKFTSGVPGKMGYEDFVWFILSEEDKTTDTALEYWFK